MRKSKAITAALLGVVLAASISACRVPKVTPTDDATLSVRVKTALLNDPNLAVQQIDADTAQGVVTLSGVVKSDRDAQKAVELARTVPGVKDVKSALQVKPQT